MRTCLSPKVLDYFPSSLGLNAGQVFTNLMPHHHLPVRRAWGSGHLTEIEAQIAKEAYALVHTNEYLNIFAARNC